MAFWQHAQTYYRKPDGTPTSEVELYRMVLRVVRRIYGHTFAADFGSRCLKALMQEMIRMRWCRRSINKHAARIKHVFKWAVGNELVPPSVSRERGDTTKEYGLEAAQVILGHKTLAVTEIYAEKNVEAARRVMAQVG